MGIRVQDEGTALVCRTKTAARDPDARRRPRRADGREPGPIASHGSRCSAPPGTRERGRGPRAASLSFVVVALAGISKNALVKPKTGDELISY